MLLVLLEASFVDEADIAAEGGESSVGIVLSEEEAVFSAGGKHAIGFVDTFGDEVVDHDAQIALAAIDNERIGLFEFESGVDTGDEALAGSFFVACGAIDLTGEIQTGDEFGFECGEELGGGSEVVFDGVAVAHDLGFFEAADVADHVVLDVSGEAGGDAVAVDFEGVAAFGFEEDLVGLFFSEANDFVFDGGAVAGSAAVDLPGVHGGAVEVVADGLVDVVVGFGQPAVKLLDVEFVVEVGKGLRVVVAGLNGADRVVDGAAVDAGGSAGFEAGEFEAKFAEGIGESAGGAFTGTSASGFGFAGVHDGLEEGACGDNDGFGAIDGGSANLDAGDGSVFDEESFGHLLFEVEIVGLFDNVFHEELIGFFVGLCAWRMHRGAFTAVEHAEVDAGGVDGFSHFSAEGVDFADDLSFGDSADGWVAAHRADHIDIHGEHGGFGAQAGGGECGFDTSVAAADNENVEIVVLHGEVDWCVWWCWRKMACRVINECLIEVQHENGVKSLSRGEFPVRTCYNN